VSVDPGAVLAEGILDGLEGETGDPVNYSLVVESVRLPLAARIGSELRLETDGTARCRHCERPTQRRFGGGYCYACFTTLARCDLCVVSPDRCHFAAGTCREPEWGQSFCMQPHYVYLADSGGTKVGITRPDNVPGRFIDQGAAAALIVASTGTRQQAGFVEKALGRYASEQTDWRSITRVAQTGVDLDAELARLRRAAAGGLAAVDSRFPGAVTWLETPRRFAFRYPVVRYDAPARQQRLAPGRPVGGLLLGVRGGYLLFDQGVFNVRSHGALNVKVLAAGVQPVDDDRQQMELFP
jgi:hypothetical protein